MKIGQLENSIKYFSKWNFCSEPQSPWLIPLPTHSQGGALLEEEPGSGNLAFVCHCLHFGEHYTMSLAPLLSIGTTHFIIKTRLRVPEQSTDENRTT